MLFNRAPGTAPGIFAPGTAPGIFAPGTAPGIFAPGTAPGIFEDAVDRSAVRSENILRNRLNR